MSNFLSNLKTLVATEPDTSHTTELDEVQSVVESKTFSIDPIIFKYASIFEYSVIWKRFIIDPREQIKELHPLGDHSDIEPIILLIPRINDTLPNNILTPTDIIHIVAMLSEEPFTIDPSQMYHPDGTLNTIKLYAFLNTLTMGLINQYGSPDMVEDIPKEIN